jgi:hypothetical protein
MTTRAEKLRARAKEAEDLAARTRDIETKRTYLEIADNWRRAAELEERAEPWTRPPETHQQRQQQQQKTKRKEGDG